MPTTGDTAPPLARRLCSFGEESLAQALPEMPSTPTAATTLRVLTLNVHGWHHADDSSWNGLVAMLQATRPDVIALQEATKHRVPALAHALGDLNWTARHSCAILSRFELCVPTSASQVHGIGTKQKGSDRKGGRKQRSEEQPRGKPFQRFCSASVIIDGMPIEIICLHLDYVREPTRLSQLREVAAQHDASHGHSAQQIWCGDFNALTLDDYSDHEMKRIADTRTRNAWEYPVNDVSTMMARGAVAVAPTRGGKEAKEPKAGVFTDCWIAAKERSGPLSTCRFDTRIDYVYCSAALMREGGACVRSCDHLQTIPHVSDHNAVLAVLEMRGVVDQGRQRAH
jgi:endonuclease/exonuclease/phosphatase family metal-dependent hydrolase